MNKKVVLGCGFGCIGVFVIGGIAATILVPKILEWGKDQLEAESQRKSVVTVWNPPEDATLESFFPQAVGGYELTSKDDRAAIQDLNFDLEGWHAIYQSDGSQIDVFVYKTTEFEKEEMFGRVDEVFEKHNGGFKSKTSLGYRMYYSSTAHHQNHLWWAKDWLFVFRTTDSTDRDPFAIEFLKTSSR